MATRSDIKLSKNLQRRSLLPSERRVEDSNLHDQKVCPFSRRVLCQFSQPSVTRSRRWNFLMNRHSSITSAFHDAAGGIRTHTQTVLETAASAVGLPRPDIQNAPGRTRTCNNVTLDHAPLPDWATEASRSMDAGGSLTLISALAGQESCH